MQAQNYKYKAHVCTICVPNAYADPCKLSISTPNIKILLKDVNKLLIHGNIIPL